GHHNLVPTPPPSGGSTATGHMRRLKLRSLSSAITMRSPWGEEFERRKVMASKKSVKAVAPRFAFQYAVKFLCTSNIPGTSQTTTSLLPGTYETVVNIHNPNSRKAAFRMKLALSTA